MLQHTCQDNSEYDECIRFFWSALSEYQRGCCYGLKRPLNLLRSLMRRLGNVNLVAEADESCRGWTTPASMHDIIFLLFLANGLIEVLSR